VPLCFPLRRFAASAGKPCDRNCLVDRKRAARNAIRERFAFDEFHDQRMSVVRFFETVDRSDVRMIQRGENFCFALKSR
jgi:hypothetical protein